MKTLVMLVLLVLVGCSYPPSPRQPVASATDQPRVEVYQPQRPDTPRFTEQVKERALLELAGPEEIKVVNGRRAITGTVVNRGRSKVGLVQICYTLLDAEGSQIGTAYTNTSGLEPGARWKFVARTDVHAGNFASYKLSELEGH